MSQNVGHVRGSAPANKRRSARQLTFQTGTIVCSDQAFSVQCAILNISEHGACILVPMGSTVSEAFTLLMDHDMARHECKLAWREGARIGASFV